MAKPSEPPAPAPPPSPKFAPRSLAGLPAPQFGPPQDIGALLRSLTTQNVGGSFVGPDVNSPAFYDVPGLGGVKRATDFLGNINLTGSQPGAIPVRVKDAAGLLMPPTDPKTGAADASNPLFALGPEGNFAGNIGEAVGPVASLAANKVIGAAADLARPLSNAAAGLDRFVPDIGMSRSLVRDTATGETLPTIFGGTNHPADAAAEAARRNALIAGSESAKAAAAVVPKGNALRTLTNAQLAALHEVTVNPADKQVIGTLLGERAFTIAPDAQIATAVNLFDRNVATQVRRASRGVEADLGGVEAALNKALTDAKVPPTPANRAAVLQSVMDRESANNIRNLAVNAARVKSTGVPAVDQVNVALAHATGDAKAGVPPTQLLEDTAAAVANLASTVESGVGPDMAAVRAATAARRAETATGAALTPEQQAAADAVRNAPAYFEGQQQLLPPTRNAAELAGGAGGGGLPPMGPVVKGAPKPLGPKLISGAGKIFNLTTDLAQASRNIASGDVSQIGSQTFPMLFKSPVAFVRGNLEGLRALAQNDAAFTASQRDLRLLVEQTGISVGGKKGQLFHRELGTNIQQGEERFAGIQTARGLINAASDRVPGVLKPLFLPLKGGLGYLKQTEKEFIGGVNAVATYGYLAGVKSMEWLYRRPLALNEKQGIADNINILLGRGYHFKQAGIDPDMVVAVSKIANAFGFSPQNTVARARIIPDTVYRTARVLNDFGHLRAPRPQDLDQVRGGAAFLASTFGVMALTADMLGVQPVLDPGSTQFMKLDLGKSSPEIGKITGVLEFAGLRTQTYNGHVYLDTGMGMAQDVRLLTQLVGPIFGHLPTDTGGHAWNPYSPKATESSAMSLLVHFAENRLHPAASTTAQIMEGHPIDMGDPTQNPITSLLIPMFIQGAMQGSGLTSPGGPLRIPGVQGPSPALAEKQRLAIDAPTIANLDTLSGDRQKQYMDTVANARTTALNSLTASQQYQALPDATKKILYTKLSDSVGQAASKAFGLNLAMNGTPEETKAGGLIAFAATPKSYDRGQLLTTLQTAQRLTPEMKTAIDAQRKQTDQTKPNYDMSVNDYIHGASLVNAHAAAPEYTFGTRQEWTSAARAAELLKKMVAEDTRKGVKPSDDQHIEEFYLASPGLSTFYEKDGSRRTKFVSPQRLAIESDLLWGRFAAAAADKEKPR